MSWFEAELQEPKRCGEQGLCPPASTPGNGPELVPAGDGCGALYVQLFSHGAVAALLDAQLVDTGAKLMVQDRSPSHCHTIHIDRRPWLGAYAQTCVAYPSE